ncbi:hypothetical protein [Candidatus Protofrankia californiensis]|uniref:hypothetical protein n=1 Tax=Candidatus Protofrankia californiensis TaxID=1839754 RepID=UPI001F49964E|nr:hypothetical protein [Candidatus Protofrankia californiensis]
MLLNTLTDAGLVLRETAEDDGDQPVPDLLALAATQPDHHVINRVVPRGEPANPQVACGVDVNGWSWWPEG